MNWEYIAGFFDGEGSTSVINKKYCNWRLSQGVKQDDVLFQIQAFLTTQNIKSHLYTYPTMANKMSYLHITKHKDVLKVLENLYPHLIVKKKIAEIVMKFVLNKKWRLDND
jgi:intein/homing endonuclease